MNGLSDINTILEKKAEVYYTSLEKDLDLLCQNLVEAAVAFRLQAPESHNFTGNLLNSIVCALYKRGTLVRSYHPKVKPAVARKMSIRKSKYYFRIDYEGGPSRFSPDVITNKGFGERDATKFVREYKSSKDNIFEIVVAYTTEYALWVENNNQTTGYMRLKDFITSINIDAFINTSF